MSTSAGSPYRTRSSAADAYLGRHASRQPTHTCRCTLTIQAPAGKRIDPVALRAALEAVALPAHWLRNVADGLERTAELREIIET